MNSRSQTNQKDLGSAKPDYGFSGGFLTVVQNIGKSLVYPIAVLPMAAILLRFGVMFESIGTTTLADGTKVTSSFMYWLGFIMQTPGSAVFDNLPLIFAIGVAFGFSKDHRGEVALVGAIAYLVLFGLVQSENSLSYLFYHNVLQDDFGNSQLLFITPAADGEAVGDPVWLLNLGVFGGIEAGLISAYCYNRWSDTQLNPALGFFSGRRFVPMVVILVMIGVSFATAAIWPWFQIILVEISLGVVAIPWLGAGFYAFANRLLLPFGLHQVLNTFFWFQMPITAYGQQVFYLDPLTGDWIPLFGDINAFISAGTYVSDGIQLANHLDEPPITGDPAWLILQDANVGTFQTGFFPIMMGGVPAIALAMAYRADGENRKSVMAFMFTGAMVAFLTGITEPIEYSFMFISPVLYFSYAVLSGIIASITVATQISFGFGFSAGLIDFIVSIQTAANLSPSGYWSILIMLSLITLAFPLYFLLGYFIIGKFEVATPGRLGNMTGVSNNNNDDTTMVKSKKTKTGANDKWERMAKETVDLVGGFENIYDIDNCITRVRLKIKDNKIDLKDIQKIGYIGYARVGKNSAQFIIGPESEIIAKAMTRLKETGYKPKQSIPTTDQEITK
ncbi:MAG: hypothetical protein GQ557_01560 [Mycoplasmataceae bacterium]|nr:hypothetical protein [Mycoplasmataceae bacterium]